MLMRPSRVSRIGDLPGTICIVFPVYYNVNRADFRLHGNIWLGAKKQIKLHFSIKNVKGTYFTGIVNLIALDIVRAML